MAVQSYTASLFTPRPEIASRWRSRKITRYRSRVPGSTVNEFQPPSQLSRRERISFFNRITSARRERPRSQVFPQFKLLRISVLPSISSRVCTVDRVRRERWCTSKLPVDKLKTPNIYCHGGHL